MARGDAFRSVWGSLRLAPIRCTLYQEGNITAAVKLKEYTPEMIQKCVSVWSDWGEPERAPPHTDRKASPRAIYMYLFFNVRTSFRKCPHVLFHWLFKFTFAHCTCTTNRVWASDRTTTNNNPSSIWSLNKRTAELCPSWTTRTAYSTKS